MKLYGKALFWYRVYGTKRFNYTSRQTASEADKRYEIENKVEAVPVFDYRNGSGLNWVFQLSCGKGSIDPKYTGSRLESAKTGRGVKLAQHKKH